VLDAHSRRVVGWSIDTHQASSLVTNALAMAIGNRTPPPGTVIHSDHGSQFTSWAFSERVRQAGLIPSMGTVGDAYDNALIESFWARLQTELLNRKKWKDQDRAQHRPVRLPRDLPQPHPPPQRARNADTN
jgi:transposase InsO family protein